jgi:hypothetical protein
MPGKLTPFCPSERLRLANEEGALGLNASVTKIPNVSSVASSPRELRNSEKILEVRVPTVFYSLRLKSKKYGKALSG